MSSGQNSPRAVLKVGFWSAVLSATLAFAWVVTIGIQVATNPPSEWVNFDQYIQEYNLIEMLNLVPSLPLASAFMVMMVAIHLNASSEKKIWTLTGLAFSIIYAVMASTNYLIQLIVVRFSVLSGQPEGLKLLVMGYPYSIFTALANSYGYQSVGLLFVAWAFSGDGLEKWIRWLLVIVGVSGIFPFVYSLFGLPRLFSAIITIPWAIGVPVGCALIAVFFRRAL